MKKVSVKIDGIEYQIVGDKDEFQIKKVANYIDEKINEIRKVAPSLSRISSTVLTTVNIVDDLFESKDKISELELKIQELKEGYNFTTENVEKEFDIVLEKLDSAESQISSLETEIESLNKVISEKENENEKIRIQLEELNLDNNSSSTIIDENEYIAKINSMELQIQDMEKKIMVAENMATEFQEQAYNLQLNLEELKKKEGFKDEE